MVKACAGLNFHIYSLDEAKRSLVFLPLMCQMLAQVQALVGNLALIGIPERHDGAAPASGFLPVCAYDPLAKCDSA